MDGPRITYGCWKGWHPRCHDPDCECDCHAGQQLVIDGFEQALTARARRAASAPQPRLQLVDEGYDPATVPIPF